MKSAKIKITAAALAAAFVFTGCGNDFYVLTPDEEDAVISYASRVVAKYNTYQQDGEVFVMQEVLDGENEEEPLEEDTELTTEEDAEEEASENTEASDEREDSASDTQTADTESPETVSTISEALNLGNIQAVYAGNRLCTTYEQSDVYAVDASAGRQLLVLNVDLSNQEKQDIHIDMLQTAPTFQVIVNETEKAMAQTTILSNDLSTFQGDIKAGETKKTVLLFEIPKEIQEITGLQLKINLDGAFHMVNL